MENKPQIIITADTEIVLEKKKAWSEVGLLVHNTNISLDNKAKELIKVLDESVPKDIAGVPDSEQILKEVKSTLTAIETERKSVTSKFDSVTKALMIHEKSVKDLLPTYEGRLIAIKKLDEEKRDKEAREVMAAKQAQEAAVTFINTQHAAIETLIAEQCQKAYEHALSTNILPENLEVFLKEFKGKMPQEKLQLNKPDSITQENWEYAFAYVDAPNYQHYKAYFESEVMKKFAFYETALANKDAAIKLAQESEARLKADREAELQDKNVAAHLETIAQPIQVFGSGVKDLKKKYEVDLVENDQNAVLIITAFLTNYKLVSEGVRVTKSFSLNIGQMAAALAWYKNRDENFTATGIKFKQIEKL